jgi:hypothetical protein
VTSFDEFLKIPGCTSGSHSSEQVAKPAPVSTTPTSTSIASGPTSVEGGVETYGVASAPSIVRTATPQPPVVEEKKPEPLEQDDPSIPVEKGTKCRRKACNSEYISEEVSRGEGEQAQCVFHPGYSIYIFD